MSSTLSTPRKPSLISAASGRSGDDPIFSLNAEARRRAAAGEDILNATIGALMTDAGGLAVIPAVFEAFEQVDPTQAAAYAPIAGDNAFLSAVVHDVFGSGVLADSARAVATAGGTGALHHAIVNFLEPGQALFTSSYFWSPYEIIATHTRRRVETFEMYDANGKFNLQAFEEGLKRQIREQGRALVLFNFPCHNPTGYSLDDDEWRGVAEILERAGKQAPVAFLVDLAYARYGAAGSEHWVDFVEPILSSCTLLVAWSASKAYAQYGSRVGALIAVTPDEQQREDIFNALSYSCRGTWSNCNHLGLLAVTRLLTDDTLRARSDAGRAQLKALLDERVAVFNREAKRAGLSYPRYEGGFFVTVFTDDAQAAAQRARDAGVFVVPIRGALRLALCSTAKQDIARLVEVVVASL